MTSFNESVGPSLTCLFRRETGESLLKNVSNGLQLFLYSGYSLLLEGTTDSSTLAGNAESCVLETP